MRQSICQKQEELPAIAVGNDMGKLAQRGKRLGSVTTVWGGRRVWVIGGQRTTPGVLAGGLIIGLGCAAFYPTKATLSHSLIMENENNMG